ncbi:NAD P-binding protein [Gloeophyllum trabeum ATCC 11539]|uniref:Probable quinone oxidoreductase n=1 Tax=Gloeophyllum trabeum (strain ATCC 11539 / FP-39264 / Madison 617) TaxID=670483 RepID=S7QLI3_GLOTA|nr:NAD P-binding protein [Gloeophyllum trabeum ATCC 11539]EPQ60227.1 NAD P-binding protein [Gloeophyllum trabeum ATCC 11539]
MSYPSTIKAVTIAKTGDFDVLEVTEQKFPEVSPDSVVVKVEYGGVNFIDTYFRKGLYPVQSFPTILGMEAAGTIVGLPTDPAVLNNEQYKLRGLQKGSKVAVQNFGVHATYAVVPWTKVFPVPSSVSTLTAAAALLQGLTCNTFMTEAYNVKKGDTVLIHTVAGGLGLIMAQYAKWRGATVIGTTSTPEKAELAKKHGADHVILYKNEDTVKRVLELTNGKGVEAIFDGVGKDTFESDFEMIARKGTIISLGNASGPVPPVAPLKLTPKNVKLLRPSQINYITEPEEALHYGKELFDLIANGTIKINVFKEYPFTAEGVQEAQKDLTGGKSTGKLVIKIA